jgi:uncharacterized membrane protein (DUF4010 family)
MPEAALFVTPWPPVPTLTRLGLSLAVGLFVGLERERRGKEAGLRTFGFAALMGGLGGLLGEAYALLALGLLGILVVIMNWQALRAHEGAELTTSAALLVTGFVGVAAGQGHMVTPVAVGVAAAALLAWKDNLAGFSIGMKEVELRSGILLAILTFIVYPALPDAPIDPWGLVEPRGAWVTVILIAALGFVNYVLLKMYGARGVALTGFLGGLVNSTVTVTELAGRVRDTGGQLAAMAYQGVLLSTAAMIVRNLVLLGILAPPTLIGAALPLALMLLGSVALSRFGALPAAEEETPLALELQSPFSLMSAIKFGLIFLALQVVGTVAQNWLGQVGFYAVSLVGGVVSSASAVASAAALAEHGRIADVTAGTGAVLASLASALVNLPMVARVGGNRPLTRRLMLAMSLIGVLGILGAIGQLWLVPLLPASLLRPAI